MALALSRKGRSLVRKGEANRKVLMPYRIMARSWDRAPGRRGFRESLTAPGCSPRSLVVRIGTEGRIADVVLEGLGVALGHVVLGDPGHHGLLVQRLLVVRREGHEDRLRVLLAREVHLDHLVGDVRLEGRA